MPWLTCRRTGLRGGNELALADDPGVVVTNGRVRFVVDGMCNDAIRGQTVRQASPQYGGEPVNGVRTWTVSGQQTGRAQTDRRTDVLLPGSSTSRCARLILCLYNVQIT